MIYTWSLYFIYSCVAFWTGRSVTIVLCCVRSGYKRINDKRTCDSYHLYNCCMQNTFSKAKYHHSHLFPPIFFLIVFRGCGALLMKVKVSFGCAPTAGTRMFVTFCFSGLWQTVGGGGEAHTSAPSVGFAGRLVV